ncbi:MAG: bi-domain-containing oxidoreductase [Caldilineaceae bacterium]
MKQLVQSSRTGQMDLLDTPIPAAQAGMVVVQNAASLVSAGTERTLVDFAKKNLLQKARSRPDLVAQVKEKIQRDGLLTTLETVQTRLDAPMALGYSSAGVVIEVGADVSDFAVGDRVACAGFGYAVHAEVIAIPTNLVVKLPEKVSFDDAAFTTLGAIALQGIRQATPQLGDNVAVIGLGLLGQLTVQLLHANGCRVFGIDLDPARVTLAQELGAEAATIRQEAEAAGSHFTNGRGFDVVLITADTRNNDPLVIAGELARDKGVVVAVGAVGMEIPRKAYYMKELDLRLSRSYGPGRYDPYYEEAGIDYPYGYVRWTENRNMQAFIALLAKGKVDVGRLTTHRFPIIEAQAAYQLISGATTEPYLGILLTYPTTLAPTKCITLNQSAPKPKNAAGDVIRVGMLGAGAYANSVLLPAIQKTLGLQLRTLCTASGLTGVHSGNRFGFSQATTDPSEIYVDEEIDLVAIATPHNLHAEQVLAALEHNKHVFCEKPLCLNREELAAIVAAYKHVEGLHLMVGFNRRFAPLAQKLKAFLVSCREPLLLHYRINGGYVPLDNWIQDPQKGGGRLIGEVCHFVDFLTYLTGTLPEQVTARALPNQGRYANDNVTLLVTYLDGSVGTITYAANGDKGLGKERIEVFGGGRSAVLEDFRHLTLMNTGKRQTHQLRLKQDKGHAGEWQALLRSIQRNEPSPIPFHEIVATTATTFCAIESLVTTMPVTISLPMP